ncbi:MAG: hypothetical protein L0Y42_07230, partial [Phycisphaerales bacterium]|nr:hypothetical protein [Phycisphaerales bacterium]
DAMIFSSAYATVLSAVVPLTTDRTVLISDELNHKCIINAMRMAEKYAAAVAIMQRLRREKHD